MPISIAKGYEAGLQSRRAETAARSTEAFKGLEMGALLSDIRTRKKAARQARNIEAGVQGYLGGDPEAAGVLQGLGPEGRKTLVELDKQKADQLKANNEQREASMTRDLAFLDAAPEEQKEGLRQAISARHLEDWANDPDPEEEFKDETADFIMDVAANDPEKWRTLANAAAGVEEKVPTGDFVVYENPNNSRDTKNVNEATAEGQKFLADNPDWIKKPSRSQVGELPAGKADDLRARLDANKGARKQIAFAIDALREDRTRGGLVGQVRKTTQSFISAMRDFSTVTGIEIGDDLASGLADSDIMKFFDKKLPDLQIIENSLAYAVARQRKPNRTLNAQDVQLAKDDTQIMGITDTDSVIERLLFLDHLIGEDSKSVEGRLGIKPASLPRYRMGKDGKLEKVE